MPAAVILEPDYAAEFPLASEEGMLSWGQTGASPQFPAWQETFGAGFHFGTGWRITGAVSCRR